MKTQFIIGIAGGSGSGKTTVAKHVKKTITNQSITLIPHDNYYKNQDHLEPQERTKTNYDHPNSLETSLLVSHLKSLKSSQQVQQPTYDFTNHTRSSQTITTDPTPIIVVEGILIFAEPQLCDLFNLKIFVQTDSDIRFIRRLKRDISERGRDLDSVIAQHYSTVKPMHQQFVEPSKRQADIIIPEGGQNQVALDLITNQIRTIISKT